MTKTAKHGFTLIELLVVISIIGILATLVVANMNAARSRARDSVRKADLKNVQTALRMYYNDKGSYPAASAVVWGSPFSLGTTVYMSKLPVDPLPGNPAYTYNPDSANDTFILFACLENTSDSSCDKDASGNIVVCYSGTGCNYTLKP